VYYRTGSASDSEKSDMVQAILQSEGLSQLSVERLEKMLASLLSHDSSAASLPAEEVAALLIRMLPGPVSPPAARPAPKPAAPAPAGKLDYG
jgi:hypothetical protein